MGRGRDGVALFCVSSCSSDHKGCYKAVWWARHASDVPLDHCRSLEVHGELLNAVLGGSNNAQSVCFRSVL